MNVFEHGADLLICKAGRGWTFTISQKKVRSKNLLIKNKVFGNGDLIRF